MSKKWANRPAKAKTKPKLIAFVANVHLLVFVGVSPWSNFERTDGYLKKFLVFCAIKNQMKFGEFAEGPTERRVCTGALLSAD